MKTYMQMLLERTSKCGMNRLKHDSQDAVNNATTKLDDLAIPDDSPAPHGRTPGGGCRDDRTRGGDLGKRLRGLLVDSMTHLC